MLNLLNAIPGMLGGAGKTVSKALYNVPNTAMSAGDELGGLLGGNIAGAGRSGILNQISTFAQDPGGVQMLNMLARALGGHENRFINGLTGMTDRAAQGQQYARINQGAQDQQMANLQALVQMLGGGQAQPVAGSPGTVAGSAAAGPSTSSVLGGQSVQTNPFAGVHSQINAAIPGAQSGTLRDRAVNTGMISPMARDVLQKPVAINPFQAGANAAQSQPQTVQPQVQAFNPLADTASQYLNAVVTAGQNPFVPALPRDLSMGQLMGLGPEHLQQIIGNQQFDANLRDQRAGAVMTAQNQAANRARQEYEFNAQQTQAQAALEQRQLESVLNAYQKSLEEGRRVREFNAQQTQAQAAQNKPVSAAIIDVVVPSE